MTTIPAMTDQAPLATPAALAQSAASPAPAALAPVLTPSPAPLSFERRVADGVKAELARIEAEAKAARKALVKKIGHGAFLAILGAGWPILAFLAFVH